MIHDWLDELNMQLEARHAKNPVVYPSLSSDESLVLRAIADNPFIYKTQLREKVDLFGSLDDALSKLERLGFAPGPARGRISGVKPSAVRPLKFS